MEAVKRSKPSRGLDWAATGRPCRGIAHFVRRSWREGVRNRPPGSIHQLDFSLFFKTYEATKAQDLELEIVGARHDDVSKRGRGQGFLGVPSQSSFVRATALGGAEEGFLLDISTGGGEQQTATLLKLGLPRSPRRNQLRVVYVELWPPGDLLILFYKL